MVRVDPRSGIPKDYGSVGVHCPFNIVGVDDPLFTTTGDDFSPSEADTGYSDFFELDNLQRRGGLLGAKVYRHRFIELRRGIG